MVVLQVPLAPSQFIVGSPVQKPAGTGRQLAFVVQPSPGLNGPLGVVYWANAINGVKRTTTKMTKLVKKCFKASMLGKSIDTQLFRNKRSKKF